MHTAADQSLGQTLECLLGDQRKANARLEESLSRGRVVEELMRVALTTGDVVSVLSDTRVADETARLLGRHLTIEQTRVLLKTPRSGHAHLALSGLLEHATGDDLAVAISAIAKSTAWPDINRIQLLVQQKSSGAAFRVASAISQDPWMSVFAGVTLGTKTTPWTRATLVAQTRTIVAKGRNGAYFQLGAAFACDFRDPELTADLVDLLATFPTPETAARLAAQLPPMKTGRPAEVAQRLADLDMIVDAVAQDGGH